MSIKKKGQIIYYIVPLLMQYYKVHLCVAMVSKLVSHNKCVKYTKIDSSTAIVCNTTKTRENSIIIEVQQF